MSDILCVRPVSSLADEPFAECDELADEIIMAALAAEARDNDCIVCFDVWLQQFVKEFIQPTETLRPLSKRMHAFCSPRESDVHKYPRNDPWLLGFVTATEKGCQKERFNSGFDFIQASANLTPSVFWSGKVCLSVPPTER
ncbi:hypothetical protein EET67_23870 [Pseudaminobacter arsenicus]|uniref:Uncharacterized protein n=1 Tax=Borborobacter arsenicus TaxID=1851146 RepID=A0A432UZI8_9HYPH|nr:hypothetical protein EET67_23870 [Pseudaminobacter arsenicus]